MTRNFSSKHDESHQVKFMNTKSSSLLSLRIMYVQLLIKFCIWMTSQRLNPIVHLSMLSSFDEPKNMPFSLNFSYQQAFSLNSTYRLLCLKCWIDCSAYRSAYVLIKWISGNWKCFDRGSGVVSYEGWGFFIFEW